jgi:ABC-type nitrate/sulfonate/bicarbonate transport system permease component
VTVRQRRLLRMAMPWLFMVVTLVLWEIACIAFAIEEIILPRPTRIFEVILLRADILLEFCAQTLWTTIIGFLIAIGGGMLLGLLIGASPFIYSGLYPLLIAFNAIPKVAIVPILMIWVGVGALPAVITAFVISFFPIVVNVATGLATIEPEMRDVLRSLGASQREILTKVGIPRAMPYRDHSGLHRVGDLRDRGRQPRRGVPHALGVGAQRCAHHLRRPLRHRRYGHPHVCRLRAGGAAHDALGVPRRDRRLSVATASFRARPRGNILSSDG